jgi:hypothetical protein
MYPELMSRQIRVRGTLEGRYVTALTVQIYVKPIPSAWKRSCNDAYRGFMVQ